MSRFRRKAGASRLLARYVRASNGRAGWRAVVGRSKRVRDRKASSPKPDLGQGPIWAVAVVVSRIRNRSAKTSGRSTSTGRACRRGLGSWAHRQATWRTDCRLISAPTAAMVALRQPGNRRNRPFLLPKFGSTLANHSQTVHSQKPLANNRPLTRPASLVTLLLRYQNVPIAGDVAERSPLPASPCSVVESA